MARIFSAIDIEDDEQLDNLAEIQETLNLGFNKIPERKMHVTLEFFEDINQEQIDKVKNAIEHVEEKPFEASVKGIGAFPSEDYIRVVWAGLKSPEIFELKKQVSRHGVSSQDRNSFTPHITLLRVNNLSEKKKTKLQKSIESYRDIEIGEIRVNKIKLFESLKTDRGTEYRELKVKEL